MQHHLPVLPPSARSMRNDTGAPENWKTEFHAKAGDVPGTAEMTLIGYVDTYYGLNVSAVQKAINDLGDFKTLNLRVHSPGGSVFEGFAIYQALKNLSDSGVTINVQVLGLAGSIMSVIAMVGDTIDVPATAMVMIHEVSGGIYGTKQEIRKYAEDMAYIEQQAVAAYVSRTGLTAERVLALMEATTWMNGADALKLGFATKSSAAKTMTNQLSKRDLELLQFKNVPQNLLTPEKTLRAEADELIAESNRLRGALLMHNTRQAELRAQAERQASYQ